MNIDRTSISYVKSVAQEAGMSGATPVEKTITIDYSNASGGNPIIQISQDGSYWEEPNITDLYTVSPRGTSGTINFNVFRYFTSTYNGSGTPHWRLKSGNQVSESRTLTAPGKLPNTLKFDVLNDAIDDFGKSKSQFKNILYVKIPALANAIGEFVGNDLLKTIPRLTQIKIEAWESNINHGKTITNISYGASLSHGITLTNVQYSCKIKIKITDAFERTWTYEIGTYTKVNNFSLPTSSLSLKSPNSPIKPYSNKTEVKFSLPTFTNSRLGELRYLYSFSYGNRKVEFSEQLDTQKSEYSMTCEDFKNKIINLFIQATGLQILNDQYTVKLDLIISNGFENKSFNTSFGVNFIESPTITSEKITLRYGNSEITSDMKLNANEKITFDIPTTNDSNDDVVSYEIGWKHEQGADITDANIKQQLEYVVPAISTNVDYWFSIRAKDSKGNTSAWSSFAHKIVIGRTSSPVFSIANLDTKVDGEGTQLSFEINVADFGGDFRTPPTPKIKVDLGDSINSMRSTTINYEDKTNKEDKTYKVTFNVKKAETMYARFTLIVPYGEQGNKISKTSQVFTIGKLPTVVYRPNRIGINTADLEANSSLTIQTYGEYNKITLKTPENNKITIDLAKKNIDGLTITCGSW